MSRNTKRRTKRRWKREARIQRQEEEKQKRYVRIRTRASAKDVLGRLFHTLVVDVPISRVPLTVPESTMKMISSDVQPFAERYWEKLLVDYKRYLYTQKFGRG